MENNSLKKGDKVSFDLAGKTLSGKIVEMSDGSAYKVVVNNAYYVVDLSELSKEGKDDKPTKKVGRPPKDKNPETDSEEGQENTKEDTDEKVEEETQEAENPADKEPEAETTEQEKQ